MRVCGQPPLGPVVAGCPVPKWSGKRVETRRERVDVRSRRTSGWIRSGTRLQLARVDAVTLHNRGRESPYGSRTEIGLSSICRQEVSCHVESFRYLLSIRPRSERNNTGLGIVIAFGEHLTPQDPRDITYAPAPTAEALIQPLRLSAPLRHANRMGYLARRFGPRTMSKL
jgi:hypothetical protein